MIALSFRTKLALAMMGLVAAVAAVTLLITENQVQVSYERHFEQAFTLQLESFLLQRAERLAPVQVRVAEAAGSPRLIAARVENPDDVNDLYVNGIDQLSDLLKAYPQGRTNSGQAFFFFLNNQGEVLSPDPEVKLPFVFPHLGRITAEVERIGRGAAQESAPQVGYLAPEDAAGIVRIREMVFTPIVDQVGLKKLGVLAVGLPLPETAPAAAIKAKDIPADAIHAGAATQARGIPSAIWLDGQLQWTSGAAPDLPNLAQDISARLQSGQQFGKDFIVRIQGVPHQVYCRPLDTGPAFPPARQVCLFSIAEAEAEKQHFRQKILFSGTAALLGALGLSLLISRGLVVPLQELVTGAAKIEHGDYAAKVPVRSRDEIGQLALAFNDMTQKVEASHIAQEQRIAERTAELAERRRAEEALRQSEASLREAQRIAHVGNWRWNILTNSLQWSDEIYSIFGLAPQQFEATYEGFLRYVHPEDLEKVKQAVSESLSDGKHYSLDHRVLRPDGQVRIVHERAEVVRDSAGKAVQMVGTVQDITEQKRIEAEFLRAQRLDSIGALAGGMAHDLNNALSPILMGIQLIRRQAQDADTQQMLAVMEANTHRGAEMVRQVLTFARGHDGERELLNLGRLLREMENILRQTLPKSINVSAMAPPDLWPALGNSTQLHQVLLNLCINARDAMPNGGQLMLAADNVELGRDENSGLPPEASGPCVMLLVADTGTGIAPEVLPKIFEPFFTTKGPGKGTGLGLSTIVRIVRSHGGWVSVKTEVGAGTTFEIYLPRAAPALPADRVPVLPEKLPLGHGELILFVDDDRSVSEMVVPTLAEHGYRVLSAANGAEAMTLLHQHQATIRLVLTDLAMPVMDGAAVLELLRAARPDLPVILMSGELDSTKGHPEIGATAFLRKPFRLEQLLSAIAEGLHPAPRA